MKNKKLIKSFGGLLSGGLVLLFSSPVFAECPETAILKGIKEGCDDGTAIFDVLAIVINVLTFGIGTAAVVGLVLSGYQYITARDNSAQVAKAKVRILQIVIGLGLYAAFYAILNFLFPVKLLGV